MSTSKKLIIRLSRYKTALKRLNSLGFIKVFSDNISDAVGVTPSQVRKDFSLFGIPGNKRGGYIISDLLNQLKKILGKDEENKVIVVGVGNIGTALVKYKGFRIEGIKIIAGFDIYPEKFDDNPPIPLYHIDKLEQFVKKNNVRIGIIAVPDEAAQSVLNIMISAGIIGILNFSSLRLIGNEDTIIHNINLQTELESLIYFVNAAKQSGPGKD